MITAVIKEEMKLVMWEAKSMEKRVKEGKEWVGTGEQEIFTVYTFRDEFGDVLKFMEKGDKYRHLENEIVELSLSVAYDDYNNKNVVKIATCIQLAT